MSLVGQYLRLKGDDERLGIRHADLNPTTLNALDEFDRNNPDYRIICVGVGLKVILGNGYIKVEDGGWRREALTVISGAPELKVVGREGNYTAIKVTFKGVGDAVAWALDGAGIDTRTGEKRPVRLRFVLLACLPSRDEQLKCRPKTSAG
jgi:hypothetical protein